MLIDQPNPYLPALPQVLRLDWPDFEFGISQENDRAMGELAEWSVVAYMAANCDLAPYLFDNLQDMKSVGSSPGVHVTVLFAGPLVTDSFFARLNKSTPLSQDLICRFSCFKSHDFKSLTVALQMADRFPSKRRLVFLCGHGMGWKGALLNQDLSRPYLTDPTRVQFPARPAECMQHLRQCQIRAEERLNRPPIHPYVRPAVLAYDACYMGNLEAVATLSADAETFVVTEGRAPGQGFPYRRILQHLQDNPTLSTDDLARYIVVANRDAYASAPVPITQTALRSEGLVPVSESFVALVQLLNVRDPAILPAITAAMENTAMFGRTGNIDLKEFVLSLLENPLPSPVTAAANKFLQACTLLELETTDPNARSKTLSIYAPRPDNFDTDYIELSNTLPHHFGIWAWFLASYYHQTLQEKTPHHPLLKAMQATMIHYIQRGIYKPGTKGS